MVIICTTEYIAGHEIIETLDVVRGSTVRARHVGRDFLAGVKNVVGGELRSYTELMSDAREQAIDRMIADAEDIGADAVVGVRFMTSAVVTGASEILAFGTAVRIRKRGET